MIKTIQYIHDAVRIIDQTKLPAKLVYEDCRNLKSLIFAIKTLKVRGAPALGVAAAFGVVLGVKDVTGNDRTRFIQVFHKVCDEIAASRPTAVNLFYALDQMKMVVQLYPNTSVQRVKHLLKKKAREILETDRRLCRQIGAHGAALIHDGDRVMTICNAGALATADYGTALGIMYAAQQQKKKFRVYVCETRPLLQGARLTAWELMRHGIDVTLITDSMAASVMRDHHINAVLTGADRVAANGDTANKIGTYSLAVLAKAHQIPFYIAAPGTTFDLRLANGEQIPIEQRDADEVRCFQGRHSAPKDVGVWNPAFDVTPHSFITGLVTEFGLISKPDRANIKKMFDRGSVFAMR